MRLLIFILTICLLSEFASAKKLGVGCFVGEVNGINGKYFISTEMAIESTISIIDNHGYVSIDFLIHDFDLLPRIERGPLPIYYGVGIGVHKNLSMRVIGGVEYMFSDYPFGLFMCLISLIEWPNRLTLTGGFGGRYYFR